MTFASDPVVTAQRLTAALEGVEGRLGEAVAATERASRERDDALAKYGRRNRQLIWTAIASVAVDILLSVVVTLFAVQAHNASESAKAATMRSQHAAASNLALCRASNVARHQQIELWDFLLSLGNRKHQTQRQKTNITVFEKRLHIIFAPRDCVALGKKKPPA